MRAMDLKEFYDPNVILTLAQNNGLRARNEIVVMNGAILPDMRHRLVIAIAGAAHAVLIDVLEAGRRNMGIVTFRHELATAGGMVEIA